MRELTEKEKIARSRVCLPLDGLDTLDEVKARVEELSPIAGMFKIGNELFTRFGPSLVRLIQSYGSEVFLDLKYHDIPNTVKGAAKAASKLGVSMFNVHVSGGTAMMKAAVEGVKEGFSGKKPKILGVTVLTSIDKETMNEELKVSGGVEEQVLHLAKMALKSGLDGIVCSPADVHAIKKHLPDTFMFVTPGVKGPKTAAGQDQKRVLTPGKAIQDGCTMLVIGRAITDAKDRVQAGLDVLEDIARVL